jgi:hypothetical protein
MRIHSTYIVKQTTRGENTKTALQSVGRAKGKGAACVRTSIKREAQINKLSNIIGAVDYRRELAKAERAQKVEAGQVIRSERQIERMMKRAQRRKAKR